MKTKNTYIAPKYRLIDLDTKGLLMQSGGPQRGEENIITPEDDQNNKTQWFNNSKGAW